MDCIFCKIINREIYRKIVYEDNTIIGIKEINPQAPVHILIIPKKHISKITSLKEEDKELIGHIYLVANKIAKEYAVFQCGFRIVINSGPDAGEEVDHLHFHLLGGRKLEWLLG